ncbi:MAG: SpoIIE family protein phosphatase [Thermoanaerobaculia bacterium]
MPHVDHASYVRPASGHRVGGDAAVVARLGGGVLAAIVDVLGHGSEAHQVARRAAAFLRQPSSTEPKALIEGLHEHLRGSRGAAAGISFVEPAADRLRYAGLGNTVIRKFGAREVRLVSRDGVLGERMRTPREEELGLTAGDVVVLYTDGVRAHFRLDDYPRLLSDTAATAARKIVEDFGKAYDDAGCIVLRIRR